MGPKSEYLKSHKFDQQVTISVKYLALLFDILFKSLWPNCVGFYQYPAHRDYHLNPGFLEYGPLFIPYSELSAVCSLTMYLLVRYGVWQYGLSRFQGRDTKLDILLAKNQHYFKKIILFIE